MKKLTVVALLTLCVGIVWAQRGGSGFMVGMGAAEEASGGGTLVFARNEGMAPPQFGYYFLVDGRLVEIETTGPQVIKKKEIEEIPDKGPVNKKLIDALKIRTKTKLPNARLVEIALERTKGKEVLSYTLNVVEDDIHVVVRTDGGSVTMELTNGKPVR